LSEPTGRVEDPGLTELDIRVSESGSRMTVHLAGELDITSAPALETVLRGIVRDASAIILDLEELTFIDSTGVACILSCQESCRRFHTDFLLTPRNSRAKRLLALTGLLDRLPFVDTGESG
jgi:anti-sigma B factor antagonist